MGLYANNGGSKVPSTSSAEYAIVATDEAISVFTSYFDGFLVIGSGAIAI